MPAKNNVQKSPSPDRVHFGMSDSPVSNLNSDNAFSANGLENTRLLKKAMNKED